MKNQSIHCLDRFTHMTKNAYIYYLDLTSMWRWWRRRPACAVERRRRRRRRPACVCGRVGAVAVAEEIGLSGVDDGRGDRRSRERQRLREFWDEKWNDTGQTTIYRFENISRDSSLEPLLIVLESEWIGSGLQPLMMKVLSAMVQN
jgi:hypothetical protein